MNLIARPMFFRHFHRMAWLAALFTASTIMFGGFVRLSDAGMSCPDWPTCYGQVTWPRSTNEANAHAASKIRPLESQKVWREQVHRFLAGALGIEVLFIALLAARKRRLSCSIIFSASGLVVSSIPLYIGGYYHLAAAVAIAGEALLLFAAWHWSNEDLARASVLTLAVVILQALLGMWTVTWLLKPIVVMGHLLGALGMFSLLVWIAWRASHLPITVADSRLRGLLRVGLAVLIIQIALGGWVSANYAALACGGGAWQIGNFPQCVGQWWPQQNFFEGFALFRNIGVDYEGGVLDGPSRIAIQMGHRFWAIATTIYLIWLAWRMWPLPGLRVWAIALWIVLGLQILFGVLNVKLAMPLVVGVLHNGGAVALTFILVSLLARLRIPE